MNCEQLPDVLSYNVVGEIKGTQFPGEIITVGGHLDCWDLAEGAHDDGSGCVQSIQVIRTIKSLGIETKRTIRAVMFMNEENGLRGAEKYAELATVNKENHIFAMESDAGGFGPVTLGIDGKPGQEEKLRSWLILFKPYGVYEIPGGGGGADIGPLKKYGAVMCGVNPNSQRYFDYHHAPNDIFEAVNKRELELGAINMTAIIYLVSKYGLTPNP
ncbi:MAG: M20/M25/M40 family metallo-hydrolase [Bacteroidota bacterium]|nr:M20/M25/M40 family metallo-hydrolase [Bacteroidota bacterium]